MTSIVAIQCLDGVVIAADSAATFGDGRSVRTIEQTTEHKIRIIGDKIIVATTGGAGHAQRLNAVLEGMFASGDFKAGTSLDIAKRVSQKALKDFAETFVQQLDLGAFVAYEAGSNSTLCEFPPGSLHPNHPTAFQPELKEVDDMWFASAGSGQTITDPFLALFKEIFWNSGPPDLSGGKFTAMWALMHACNVNPGGIKEPIHIATLARDPNHRGQWRACLLDEDEIAEHANMVTEATNHMRAFKDVLEGKASSREIPKPGKKP